MTTITVYHGTNANFSPQRPGGPGQVYFYPNPPIFNGFWVTTEIGTAWYFTESVDDDDEERKPRVHVYEMTIDDSCVGEGEVDEDWEEVPDYIGAVLDSEDYGSHVVHNTSLLTYIETIYK